MAVTDVMFEALKDRVVNVERQQAVKSATDTAIETRLTNIETVLSRLTWLLVSPIATALFAFIIGGGLNLSTAAIAGTL